MSDYTFEKSTIEDSAINEDAKLVRKVILVTVVVTLGILFCAAVLATVTIVMNGWYNVYLSLVMGSVMGTILSRCLTGTLQQKDKVIAAFAVLTCVVTIALAKYVTLYWFVREDLGHPFDFRLISYFFSTSEIWTIADFLPLTSAVIIAWILSKNAVQAIPIPAQTTVDEASTDLIVEEKSGTL